MNQPYIRKKNDKFIIEIKADAKTIFLKTLPDVNELLELITLEPSQSYIENKIKESKKASSNDQRLESEELPEEKVLE